MISGNFAICMNISLMFPPSYWRGYLSPQGQEENSQENQIFEEVAGKGDADTSVPSLNENRWETTKLGCRHSDKTKAEKLVNGKNTAHVRTRNGLSHNGHGQDLPNSKYALLRS